ITVPAVAGSPAPPGTFGHRLVQRPADAGYPHRSNAHGMRNNTGVTLRAGALSLLAALLTACASAGSGAATEAVTAPVQAPGAASGEGWGQRTAQLERRDGFIPMWISRDGGTVHLELPEDSLRALFHVKQATGLGSNPIGIDRGASGGAQVVRFQRVGDRMLVIFENWRYRSSLEDTLHQRTIRESFPVSPV